MTRNVGGRLSHLRPYQGAPFTWETWLATKPSLVIEVPLLIHPRFFDEQLGSAVGTIDYVGGSGN